MVVAGGAAVAGAVVVEGTVVGAVVAPVAVVVVPGKDTAAERGTVAAGAAAHKPRTQVACLHSPAPVPASGQPAGCPATRTRCSVCTPATAARPQCPRSTPSLPSLLRLAHLENVVYIPGSKPYQVVRMQVCERDRSRP